MRHSSQFADVPVDPPAVAGMVAGSRGPGANPSVSIDIGEATRLALLEKGL